MRIFDQINFQPASLHPRDSAFMNACRIAIAFVGLSIHFLDGLIPDSIPLSQTLILLYWMISIYSVAVIVLSYTNEQVRLHLHLFVYLLYFTLVFVLSQRVAVFKFVTEAHNQYLIITLLCTLFFNRKLLLFGFQLFATILLFVVAIRTELLPENVWFILFRFTLLNIIIFYILTIRIDRWKLLRRQDAQYKLLFQRLHNGIIHLNLEGDILHANPLMQELSGYSIEELKSKSVYDLFQQPEMPSKPTLGSITGMLEFNSKLSRKDGRNIWVKVGLSNILQYRRRKGTLTLVCTDTHQQKEAELSLRRYSEKLSLANKELEQFSYFASHDLKAPIHTIRDLTRQLSVDYLHANRPLDSQAVNNLQIISKGTQRMHNLVDALQVYAGYGMDSAYLAEIDMNKIVAEALENLAGYIHAQNARIYYEKLPIVEADRVQMIRLVQNLIENAIIYRKGLGPEVHISASVNNSSTGYIFTVEDNGIGIEAKDYPNIFNLYQEAKDQDQQGLGIGLAICKKIIENHKGRIWLKSIKGRGTTVYFFLPTSVDI